MFLLKFQVGTVNGANRELLAPVPSDKDVPPNSYCQRVSSVAPNFPPPFGRFPVNISSFEPGPYPGPVFDFPLPSMYHSRMSMMDGAGVMPFDDMLYANGRCALPFNTDQPYPPFRYDCDDFSPGIDPIRIRHVYDLRKAQQRRYSLILTLSPLVISLTSHEQAAYKNFSPDQTWLEACKGKRYSGRAF